MNSLKSTYFIFIAPSLRGIGNDHIRGFTINVDFHSHKAHSKRMILLHHLSDAAIATSFHLSGVPLWVVYIIAGFA